MGTAFLNDLTLKSFEKLYFFPNSVYWAEVTRSCSTSRCESSGWFFHASMRQSRMRARPDMAGDKSFTILPWLLRAGNPFVSIQNYGQGTICVPVHHQPALPLFHAGISFPR